MRLLELVRRDAEQFDVLHFHIDFWPFSLFSRQRTPFVSTMHGRMDRAWVRDIYDLFPKVPLVSVSNAQRAPVPHLNWAATVLHGMPCDLLHPAARRNRPILHSSAASLPRRASTGALDIAAACGCS